MHLHSQTTNAWMKQLHICWLFWVSDWQLYFTQRRGTGTLPVFQDRCGAAAEAELVQAVVQLLSRLSASCVTCVIANFCRMPIKLMMLSGAQSESLTLSPASVKLKAEMFGLLNPHTEQQEVKSWEQTTNRPFMNMLDVCHVSVHHRLLPFISNLIALTLHWIFVLLPLLSSLLSLLFPSEKCLQSLFSVL